MGRAAGDQQIDASSEPARKNEEEDVRDQDRHPIANARRMWCSYEVDPYRQADKRQNDIDSNPNQGCNEPPAHDSENAQTREIGACGGPG